MGRGESGQARRSVVRSYLQVLALRMGILTDECHTAKLKVLSDIIPHYEPPEKRVRLTQLRVPVQ